MPHLTVIASFERSRKPVRLGDATSLEEAKVAAVSARLEGARRVTAHYMLPTGRIDHEKQPIQLYPLDPRWVVYGTVGNDPRSRRSVHKSGLTHEADAVVYLMDLMLERPSELHAVIVQLDNGEDRNGERHVIRRIGDGKAWWE